MTSQTKAALLKYALLVSWLMAMYGGLRPTAIGAQFSFDVKTPFAQKNQLQIVKAGALTTIQGSTWATVIEVGEDYSLWLMDLDRRVSGDSMLVSVLVELRTKAMITRGRLLNSARVVVSYDRAKAKHYVVDSVSVALAEINTD